mgnify:CR=1 FL=1
MIVSQAHEAFCAGCRTRVILQKFWLVPGPGSNDLHGFCPTCGSAIQALSAPTCTLEESLRHVLRAMSLHFNAGEPWLEVRAIGSILGVYAHKRQCITLSKAWLWSWLYSLDTLCHEFAHHLEHLGPRNHKKRSGQHSKVFEAHYTRIRSWAFGPDGKAMWGCAGP